MARTDITPQAITPDGLEPTYTAAIADGHMFRNNGTEFLHVLNGSGGAVVVTLQTPVTVGGNAVAERTVSVPAGEDRMIGTLEPGIYNQPSGADRGKVYVDTDTQTSITYAVLRP